MKILNKRDFLKYIDIFYEYVLNAIGRPTYPVNTLLSNRHFRLLIL